MIPVALRRRGHTLVEALIVLALIGIVAAMAMLSLTRTLDRITCAMARDGLAAQLGRARALAAARGSARLVVDSPARRLLLDAPEGTRLAVSHFPAAGVAMTVDGAAQVVTLTFDDRGAGVLANRTFRFSCGSAEAGLTLSGYGRPRRW